MTNQNRVEIQRRFKAPPGSVYDAWTRPEIIAKWWGPEGVRLGDHEFDITEGGKWRTVMVSPEGVNHIVGGIYRELKRPHRLVTTWAWEEGGRPGDPSVVTVTFEAMGRETLMTLVHEGLASAESAAAHKMGWTSSLKCLDTLWADIRTQSDRELEI